MKKLIFSFLCLVVFVFPIVVHAQNKPEMLIAPPITNPASLLGQNHKYTVTFRGNGEAVVSSRIVLTNTEDQARSSLSLRVPKVNPTDVIAYQVIAEPTCIRYRPYQYDPANPVKEQTCLEYREPDYYNYWSGVSKYQKAQTTVHGDTIEITLPRPVGLNKNGSVILYYRVFGYARKNIFGTYEYAFETLKVEDKIHDLQVGITVDSDLYLKGVKGNVNYRFTDSAMFLKSEAAGMMTAPMANAQFDQVYRQIGQGSVTKTASNLQPLDSYTVKGSYADSRIKLYAPWLIGGSVVALLSLIVLIIVIRFMVKTLNKGAKSSPQNTTLTSTLLTLGLSGVSTTVILLYTFTLMMVMKSLSSIFPYDYTMLITLLVIIISLAVYAILLFVPAIFMGIKRGLGWGVSTAVTTIVWLVLVFFFLIIIFGAVRYSGVNNSVRMMTGSSLSAPMMAPAVDSVAVPETEVKSIE